MYLYFISGNYDCGEDDFSDEPLDENDCTCRHYLELSAPERICDSIIACPDRGDELGCPCQEGSFRCDGLVRIFLSSGSIFVVL